MTGAQITAARALIGWSRKKLADRSMLPLSVIVRAERSDGEPVITSLQARALLRALDEAGVVFSADGRQVARRHWRSTPAVDSNI